MTVADYSPFVERMIELYEGGYGWNANDPGGPTKYGITCYDLAEYMGQQMTSMATWAPIVQTMTMETAEAIYATKYATACDFNNLVAGADCVVFDFGVNSGPATSIKYAQMLVGVSVDGVLGPITQSAINDFGPVAFIKGLCDARMKFLASLSTWSDFGNGWTARVNDLQSYSLALASPPASKPATYSAKLVRILGAGAKGYPQ
jgi:lysozyme family protein